MAITRIVLDPGHGGSDTGTTGGSIIEKDYQLGLAFVLRYLLTSRYKVEVIMTRCNDDDLGLAARAQMANPLYPNCLFFSLHHNALPGNESAQGGELYIYGPTSWQPAVSTNGTVNHEAPNSYKLGRAMEPIFKEGLIRFDIRYNGIKTGNFQVLRDTNGPGILTEAFYATNPTDAKTAKTVEFQNALAEIYCQMLAAACQLEPR